MTEGPARMVLLRCYTTMPYDTYRLASTHRLVASNTARTALRSADSRISHVPTRSWASRPPRPCTATITNFRSNASSIDAPSSAIELSGISSSRHDAAARAAASTRLRTVSVPISSADASRSPNASFTRTSTRCGRSAGRTSRFLNTTTRRLARSLIASWCNASMGRTSAVCATLILRWSILNPSCAISADSMLRTTCFGWMSLRVSTCTSLTSPKGVTTTRADSTPVSAVIKFSTRLIPHGSGFCTGVKGTGSCSGLAGVTSSLPRRDLVAAGGLSAIQRAVRSDQHVLVFPVGPVFGHPDASRHEPLGVAQPFADRLHRGPHLLPHPARPLLPRAHQHDHKLVAAVAARHVGGADVRPALLGRALQDGVTGFMSKLVVHLLEVVEIHEKYRKSLAGAVRARHLRRQAIAQHPKRRQSRQRVDRRSLMRQRRLALEVGRARLERRAPLRRRHRELAARAVPARPTVPRPAVRRQTDLLEDIVHRIDRRLVAVLLHAEDGAHRDGDPIGQHRALRPRRLGRAYDFAAAEQLLTGP